MEFLLVKNRSCIGSRSLANNRRGSLLQTPEAHSVTCPSLLVYIHYYILAITKLFLGLMKLDLLLFVITPMLLTGRIYFLGQLALGNFLE